MKLIRGYFRSERFVPVGDNVTAVGEGLKTTSDDSALPFIIIEKDDKRFKKLCELTGKPIVVMESVEMLGSPIWSSYKQPVLIPLFRRYYFEHEKKLYTDRLIKDFSSEITRRSIKLCIALYDRNGKVSEPSPFLSLIQKVRVGRFFYSPRKIATSKDIAIALWKMRSLTNTEKEEETNG